MPQVTIKTGFVSVDGREEVLSEYLCDWPDCPEVAEHVIGTLRELRLMSAMCRKHAAEVKRGSSSNRIT